MALELIPFPISVVFAFVFAAAWVAVTYKLRKRGRFYVLLFKASVFAVLVLFAIFFYSIITANAS